MRTYPTLSSKDRDQRHSDKPTSLVLGCMSRYYVAPLVLGCMSRYYVEERFRAAHWNAVAVYITGEVNERSSRCVYFLAGYPLGG